MIFKVHYCLGVQITTRKDVCGIEWNQIQIIYNFKRCKMKKNLFQYVTISFLLLLSYTMNGQNSVNASGQNATGSGGSVSYSVGQLVCTTYNSSSNGSVAQGVQQPYEISVVLGVKNIGINLLMTISPNPSADLVTLKIDNYEIDSLIYQLYDLSGKLFLTGQTKTTETQISIGHLPSAVYFIKITDKNKIIKTFKIIKN